MASSSAQSTSLAPLDPTPPVTIKGRFFWQDDRRFLINGVVYQPHTRKTPLVDPLADDQLYDLERSIPLLKDLGINTIFVYYIDNSRNHDAAMNMLAEVGIYVLPCITPAYDGSGDNDSLYNSYKSDIVQWYFTAVDNMTKYPNTLGVVVSCDFIDDVAKTAAAPIIRAIVRDVKKYVRLISRKKNLRALPVGILAPDKRSLLKLQYEYYVSEPENEAIDFLGFRDFSLLKETPMQEANYNQLIEIFAGTPVPVFFSMYGNNAVSPRRFHETHSIYCDFTMLSTFSGGFVFEFFQSTGSKFGLIERAENRRGHVRFTKLDDFKNLRDRLRGSFMKLPPISCESPPSVTFGIRPRPPKVNEKWLGVRNLPESPMQWSDVEERIDDSEWIDLNNDVLNNAVDDLEFVFKERFNIDGKS